MNIFDAVKDFIGLFVVVPLVFFIGIYLSIRLRWLQFSCFSLGLKCIFRRNEKQANFSSFAALAAVLGGNLGTGNIAGVAVALATGGPGALFWMWIMALLGAIVKFTGCYLGVKYQQKHFLHSWVGGPMYYLANGMQLNKTSKLFCLFTIFAALSIGNLVQVNSVALPLQNIGVSPLLAGCVMAVVVALVLIGGMKYFAVVASRTVPFMAVIYLLACFIILGIFYAEILPALKLIVKSAFSPISVAGGVIGFAFFDAIRVGFARGLLATDAGLGLAPILHAQVASRDGEHGLRDNAFAQGLVSLVAPVIVMLICMVTGTVLLVTGAWQSNDLESTNVCIKAFQIGLNHVGAGYIVAFTLCLFSFTTILTWAHCAEKAVIFLVNERAVIRFRWCFVGMIPIGACCSVHFVWSIADIALYAMLLINMIGVVGLSNEVVSEVGERLGWGGKLGVHRPCP